MTYITDTQQIASLIEDIAARGFLSPLVVSEYAWLSKKEQEPTYQYAEFTADERMQINAYCAKYLRVLSKIKYRQNSMLSDREQFSASLLSMIQYMMTSKSSPEYVAGRAQLLREALETHRNEFEAIELEVNFKL